MQVAAWRLDAVNDAWAAAPGATVTLTTDRGSWVDAPGDGTAIDVTTAASGVASATLQPGAAVGVAHITATLGDVVARVEVTIVDAVYLEDFEAPPGAESS